MHNNIEILEANLHDPWHCIEIGHLMDHYLADPMGGHRDSHSAKKKKDLIDGLREMPNAFVLFAMTGSKFIGMAICFKGFSTFEAKPLLNIHDLIVDPFFRRLGVGETILRRVLEIGRKIDCCRITLEVRRDNIKAKRLYHKVGFTPGEVPVEFWTYNLAKGDPGAKEFDTEFMDSKSFTPEWCV